MFWLEGRSLPLASFGRKDKLAGTRAEMDMSMVICMGRTHSVRSLADAAVSCDILAGPVVGVIFQSERSIQS